MTHAVVDELKARGVSDIVVLSRDPEQSANLYGTESAKTLEFPWPPHRRERYLSEIRQVLAGERDALPAHDQVHAVIDLIRSSDGVVIAGGGNMTSPYGWLLYERAAVGAIAQAFDKPLIISGQTVGPVLTGPDYDTVVDLYKAASVSTVREMTSFQLMRDAGVTTGLSLDDASFLDVAAVDPGESKAEPRYKPGRDRPFIVGTFAPGTGAMDKDDFCQRVAEVLDHIAAKGEFDVVMVPHMSRPGQADIDIEMHRAIANRMNSGNVTVCGQLTAAEAASLTAQAEMVVASRYHPVVFALSAGVPCLGLAVDYYGEVRIGGALSNWGLGHTMRSLRHLVTEEFDAFVDQLWDARASVREHLLTAGPQQADFQRMWWDAVVETLKGNEVEAPVLEQPAPVLVELHSGEHPEAAKLTANNEAHIGHQSVELYRLTHALDDATGALAAADAELERLRLSLEGKEKSLQILEAERTQLEEAVHRLERLLPVRAWRRVRRIRS